MALPDGANLNEDRRVARALADRRAVAGAPTVPVRITLMLGARVPARADRRTLGGGRLQDAFGDVAADMRRVAPAVSKAIDVALEDGSDEERELGAFRKNADLKVRPRSSENGRK